MLHIAEYKKSYNAATVLQIERLSLPVGIYWLKGENGTGKTTLLKSIAGLIPFDGTIEVNRINLRKSRMQYTRTVSFSEAEPVYPGFLSGSDLLRFYQRARHGNDAMTTEMLSAFGVNTYLQNKIDTYSSGMLKKLSILLAFVGCPKLILLDEPFITLDANALGLLQQYIGRLSNEGVSFLFSSHQELMLGKDVNVLHVRHQTIERETHAVSAY